MKTLGYRKLEEVRGVVVMECGDLQMDLADGFGKRLGSMGELSIQSVLGPVGIDSSRPPTEWPRPCTFTYKTADGKSVEVDGCLLYETISDLACFLQERFVCQAGSSFADALEQARAGSGRCLYTMLEEILAPGSRNHSRLSRRYRNSHRATMTQNFGESGLPFSVGYLPEIMNQATEGEADDGAVCILPMPDSPTGVLVAVDEHQCIGEHRVPRLKYLLRLFGRRHYRPGDRSRDNIFCFSGSKMEIFEGISRLRARDRAYFNREGTLYNLWDFNPIPALHMRVRCLVRVPGGTSSPRSPSALKPRRAGRTRASPTPLSRWTAGSRSCSGRVSR